MVEHGYCDVCGEGPQGVVLVAGVARGSRLNVCGSCGELPDLRCAVVHGAAWGRDGEPPVTLESVLGDFEGA